jgi:hypothetical protein
MHIVDITDPTHPTLIKKWDPLQESPPESLGIHDLEISPDGNRLYLGTANYGALVGVLGVGGPTKGDSTSMMIVDVSDIQARRPNPDLKVVGESDLPNFGHTVQRMTIAGKPYLTVSGESPVSAAGCPWAWGHIVDISDETKPKRVSDLRLEVNQAQNCGTAIRDNGANYSIHYVGVDSERDTHYVFYTYYTGGMRVFDVRDPAHPVEVGYFHSPATPHTIFPALSPFTLDGNSGTFDPSTSVVRYRPNGDIWVVSVNSGFQVLRFTGKLAQDAGGRFGAALYVRKIRAARARHTGTVPVRVNCSGACSARVHLDVGGTGGPPRTVRLPGAGTRLVRLKLGGRALARLRAKPGIRIRAVADVVDLTASQHDSRVSSKPVRLR